MKGQERRKTKWNGRQAAKLSVGSCCAFVFLSIALLLTGCSMIDEDLSDCGNDYELNYELQLVTNISTELQTELSLQADVQLQTILRQQLSTVFTDHANDVNLSFYDTEGDSIRLENNKERMNANQASYTLYIPRRHYEHLAVANIMDDPIVDLLDTMYCHRACLQYDERMTVHATDATAADTVASQTAGLFTARYDMQIREDEDQTFNVRLYMANCAAALVLNTQGHHVRDIQVYTTGFASSFNICDSTYTFAPQAPIVRTTRLADDDGNLCFYSVNFPSREPNSTRLIIDSQEPFLSDNAANALWQYRIYATLDDGSVTESILGLTTPLRAGQLKIVKAVLNDDGQVSCDDATVGVSITLDWNNIDYPNIPL